MKSLTKDQEMDLDTLMYNCGYHKVFDDCNCINGYGCLHPDNTEGDDYDCKNGCKGCFDFACPIAYKKDPDMDGWGSDIIMILMKDINKEASNGNPP